MSVVSEAVLPPGARVSKAKPTAVLVATGRVNPTKAGACKVTIKLTTSGKWLLNAPRA